MKDPTMWSIFLGFGGVAFLGHMGGPWGDNSFYQRAFAIKKESIIKSFVIASFIFIVIPISMGLLGFVGAGAGLQIDNVGTTNAFVIAHYLPAFAGIIFMFIVFSGLIAILDSQFASVANMTGHDIYNKFKTANGNITEIHWARYGMIALAITGLIVANILGMQLLYLFLFFAVLRASVWLLMISLLK